MLKVISLQHNASVSKSELIKSNLQDTIPFISAHVLYNRIRLFINSTEAKPSQAKPVQPKPTQPNPTQPKLEN